MKDLERLIINCDSIDDFLSNATLIDSYFKALQNCFGSDKVDQRCYIEIIRQLKNLSEAVPEIKSRLWKKDLNFDLNFEIETWRVEGRDVNAAAWTNYMNKWASKLRKNFNDVLDFDPIEFDREPLVEKKIILILSDLLKDVEEFRSSGDQKNGQEFFRCIRRHPAYNAVASFFVYYHLTVRTHIYSRINSGEGDIVLDQLRSFKEDPIRHLVPIQFRPFAGAILNVLRYKIPSLRRFLARQDIFPVRSAEQASAQASAKSNRYFFEKSPRKFHDLWVGMLTSDCLAGTNGMADSITELRWSLCAMKGSSIQHIRNEHKYLGAIRLTEVAKAQFVGQETFWISAELLCSHLIIRVLGTDKNEGKRILPLFMFWLHKIRQIGLSHHSKMKDIVVNLGSWDHAKVFPTVNKSFAYSLGRNVGLTEEFYISDSLAKIIPQFATRRGIALNYPDTMLSSISTKGAQVIALRDIMEFETAFHENEIISEMGIP